MRNFTCQAIILARTDYGEADRILTFLTPDHGKIKALARGVRKSRSKLAGALEIFSVSQVMILPGKNEISTVMSAKLERHYGNIVKNLQRTNSAYEFMRLVSKATQEKPEADYFHLLDSGFDCLNNSVDISICSLWFKIQLLKITGHSPNLKQDQIGQKLALAKAYSFDFDKMRFSPTEKGKFAPAVIKFLRLVLSAAHPNILSRVDNSENLANKSLPLVDAMLNVHLRI